MLLLYLVPVLLFEFWWLLEPLRGAALSVSRAAAHEGALLLALQHTVYLHLQLSNSALLSCLLLSLPLSAAGRAVLCHGHAGAALSVCTSDSCNSGSPPVPF